MPRHKPNLPKAALPDGASNQFERFIPRRINRTQIESAPYNPRKITPAAKRQLRDNIERVGLVEPLIWNKRTGNLVGGHQRLSILDGLHGGSDDYKLTVSEVDLDPKDEKIQNVFLNNPGSQGTYDPTKMADLLVDTDFSLADAGFTPLEFELEFGFKPETLAAQVLGVIPDSEPEVNSEEINTDDDDDSDGQTADSESKVVSDKPAASGTKIRNSPADLKRRKAEYEATSNADPDNDSEYMTVLTFNNKQDKELFLQHNGFPTDSQYVSADNLIEMIKEEHKWRTA